MQADRVAGPPGPDEGSQIREAVHRPIGEAHDHVPALEPGAGRGGAGDDRAEPEPFGLATQIRGDPEERPAGRGGVAPLASRLRHLHVARARAVAEPLDDARGDPRHLRHARRVDLVRGVARGVVILVLPGVEEQDRRARGVERHVVGRREGRVAKRQVEPAARLGHDRAKPGAALHAAHVELSPPHPPHHVEVQHGDRALERERRDDVRSGPSPGGPSPRPRRARRPASGGRLPTRRTRPPARAPRLCPTRCRRRRGARRRPPCPR